MFQDFVADPFAWFDKLNLTLKGNNFNFFQKYDRLRNTAFWIAIISLIAWFTLGFDSTPLQFLHVLYEGIPGFLSGQLSGNDLIAIYHNFYGKEMHYSAFVIYGLEYWYLSTHFKEHLGIKKSKNVVYSCAITFLSIAVFEWFWILNFSHWQNQPWVSTWRWPQMRILLQNLAFTFAGILGILYMWADSYEMINGKVTDNQLFSFRLTKKAAFLIFLSVASALIWIYYPGHVDIIKVDLLTGETWQNTRNFPQTLYTIDLDPRDNINAGTWFYVENNLIHGWNTLVKILFTLTFLYIGLLRNEKRNSKPLFCHANYYTGPNCRAYRDS